MKTTAALAAAMIVMAVTAARADARSDLLETLAAEARASTPDFSGFSATRGETLYRTEFALGKAATPACTTCHTATPRQSGRTRAGKSIEPMALSVNPTRYADPRKVAKWFRRNCNSVLGRACTATEKGDFITFMSSQ